MDPTLIETQPIPDWSISDWLVSQAPNLLPIWIPIVVAVIALVYSIRSDRRNHRHNRLSVRPILNFQAQNKTQPSILQFELVNNGTGPAIITDIRLCLDGKLIKQPSSKEEWDRLFHTMGVEVGRMRRRTQSFGLPKVLPHGKSACLLKFYDFQGPDLEQLHRNTENALRKLTFQFSYTSIYGADDNDSEEKWETAVFPVE